MTKKQYNKTSSRRNFLRKGAMLMGGASAYVWLNTNVAAATTLASNAASTNTIGNKKLVWVFLRGAMDSLHTVVPKHDKQMTILRPHLYNALKPKLLSLNTDFGLHPALKHLHKLYTRKQMSPIVAVASGYRERSHFDAQDQMESGLDITNHDSGWIARALQQAQSNSSENASAYALSRSVPIAMRGMPSNIETWYPSTLPEASPDLLSQLHNLYQGDKSLEDSLSKVIKQKEMPSMQMKEKNRPNFRYLAERCAELLTNENANCAMLELNGWDTHNNQVGRLARLFAQLDGGLEHMQNTLGERWNDTLVIVSTEFGRTAAANGTQGTDHGTASNMFVLGGALPAMNSTLQGGKMLGQWPGLSPEQLYKNRDLMPTSDVRQWMARALSAHWGLSSLQIKRVFPDLVS